MKTKILVVEDSRLFSGVIVKRISENFHCKCIAKSTLADTVKCLEDDSSKYLMAILDLNLPDAPDGEIVDYVISKGIPAIVVTARIDDNTRDQILAKRVFDYIMKGPHTLELLSNSIRRYVRNQSATILIVDDSNIARDMLKKILQTQFYNILEASNGAAALECLKSNPSIGLIITDYHMPKMDGFELTAQIRKSYPMANLGIIGVSSQGNPLLSSQFLKRGANDFIGKPYFEEELILRVAQNIEMLDHVKQLQEASIRDHLTGLYNRRYFFNAGANLFANAKRKNLSINVAMIDIDNFKLFNDTYGHINGDLALKIVADILKNNFRTSDIVARFGGEEFIIISTNMNNDHVHDHYSALCKKVAGATIDEENNEMKTCISIGVTTLIADNFETMISTADSLLYRAKDAGRNCCVIE